MSNYLNFTKENEELFYSFIAVFVSLVLMIFAVVLEFLDIFYAGLISILVMIILNDLPEKNWNRFKAKLEEI